jgi:hypothetical protein
MMEDQRSREDREMDARLLLALEAGPVAPMPDQFTARVMASLPSKRLPDYVRQTRYGRNTILFCLLLLCAALVISARAVQNGSSAWIAVLWVFFGQLAGIAVWLILQARAVQKP